MQNSIDSFPIRLHSVQKGHPMRLVLATLAAAAALAAPTGSTAYHLGEWDDDDFGLDDMDLLLGLDEDDLDDDDDWFADDDDDLLAEDELSDDDADDLSDDEEEDDDVSDADDETAFLDDEDDEEDSKDDDEVRPFLCAARRAQHRH